MSDSEKDGLSSESESDPENEPILNTRFSNPSESAAQSDAEVTEDNITKGSSKGTGTILKVNDGESDSYDPTTATSSSHKRSSSKDFVPTSKKARIPRVANSITTPKQRTPRSSKTPLSSDSSSDSSENSNDDQNPNAEAELNEEDQDHHDDPGRFTKHKGDNSKFRDAEASDSDGVLADVEDNVEGGGSTNSNTNEWNDNNTEKTKDSEVKADDRSATGSSSLISSQDFKAGPVLHSLGSSSKKVCERHSANASVSDVDADKSKDATAHSEPVVGEDEPKARDEATGASSCSLKVKSGSGARQKKRRCHICKKKLGLTAITCRCGGLFCGIHRYDKEHNCTFDYKSMGADEIRKNNPLIIAEKVRKL